MNSPWWTVLCAVSCKAAFSYSLIASDSNQRVSAAALRQSALPALVSVKIQRCVASSTGVTVYVSVRVRALLAKTESVVSTLDARVPAVRKIRAFWACALSVCVAFARTNVLLQQRLCGAPSFRTYSSRDLKTCLHSDLHIVRHPDLHACTFHIHEQSPTGS